MITASDGVALHVTRQGEGAPVVLIPGLGGTASFWSPILSALAGYSVVLADHRGCGASERPKGDYHIARLARDILEILDAHKIDRAHVVGHSTGGVIAQYLALHAPERVNRLVLSASWMRTDAYFQLLFATRRDVLLAAGPATYNRLGALLAYPPGWFTGREAEIDRSAAAAERELAPISVTAARITMLLEDCETPDAGRITAPTLVMGARDDAIVPWHHAEMLAATIPHAALLAFEGGHFFPRVHPARYGAVLAEFLGGHA
jgi:aminoacrylate hydrolase